MNATALALTRDVTQQECDWLDRDMLAGEIVYEYSGATYGCIGSGVACTLEPGKTPFFELPLNALGDAPISTEAKS